MIADGITYLDGGMSTELENMGYSFNGSPLWGSLLLHTNPTAIVNVHKKYMEAGCNIITTASYQATLEGFQKCLGITANESIRLLKSSIELAKRAKKEFEEENPSASRKLLIAASVGPYGVSLADGSEYSGDYCDQLTHDELIEWHRPKVQHLVDAGIDLLAFETIPAAKEAEALMKLLHDFPGVKAWLSFSSQSEDKTSHKEDIGQAASNCLKLAPSGQLIAIGTNCCPPNCARSLLKSISRQVGEFPLIVYPNSGEKWISNIGWVEDKEKPISNYVQDWIGVSSKIIMGGCCRTSPNDIAELIVRSQKIIN